MNALLQAHNLYVDARCARAAIEAALRAAVSKEAAALGHLRALQDHRDMMEAMKKGDAYFASRAAAVE